MTTPLIVCLECNCKNIKIDVEGVDIALGFGSKRFKGYWHTTLVKLILLLRSPFGVRFIEADHP